MNWRLFNFYAAGIAVTSMCAGPVHADIQYKVVRGGEFAQYDSLLRPWRARYFSEFPYLFYPAHPDVYFQVAANAHEIPGDTILVCAFEGEELIGYLLGLPAKDLLLSTNQQGPDECYYVENDLLVHVQQQYATAFCFDQLLIDPVYRNTDVAQQLYEHMLNFIRALPIEYTALCMFKIEDEQNHVLRPADYDTMLSVECLERSMLTSNGFTKTGEFVNVVWSTVQAQGTPVMEQHVLQLWAKQLP